MPRDRQSRRLVSSVDRRKFIKATGAGALATTLAGCTSGGDGGGSGDGDGGGSGDGDGDSGSGDGDSGDGGGEDLQTASFVSPPVGMPVRIVMEYYLQQNDLIQPRFEEDGYRLDWELTWEDVTLFASGQMDISTMSYVDAARLGVEQDQDLVCFGSIEGVVTAHWVKPGGPYDPAETGGVQETLDKVVEEDARFGIPGWAAGTIPYTQNILDQLYGYTLAENGGDFNIQTTDRGTMPGLVKNGELAIGTHSSSSAGLAEIVNGELKPLFYPWNVYIEQDWGRPPLVNLICRRDFAEQNPEVLLHTADMWQEGMDWVTSNIEEIATDPEGQETLEAENEEQARFVLNHFAGNEVEPIEGFVESPLYEEVGLDDSDVETADEMLTTMEDVGQIPSGWGDHVSFMTRSEIEGMI